jgi:quinol monooxygenase YgiN
MDQKISFVVRLPGKPEARDELYSSLINVLDEMSQEPDFVNTTLHRAVDDPDTLVVYETWEGTAEHFLEHHMKKQYRVDYERKLETLLKSARTFEWLDPIRSYVKGN